MKKGFAPDVSRFIRNHSKEMERIVAERDTIADRADHFVMIGFLQNERMAHLHVLLAIIGFLLISLILIVLAPQIGTFVLFLLFVGLLIPYVFHYVFLENTIQRWYEIYRELEDIDSQVR